VRPLEHNDMPRRTVKRISRVSDNRSLRDALEQQGCRLESPQGSSLGWQSAGFCQRDSTNEQIKNTAVPIQISTAAFFSPGADLLFILLSLSFLGPLDAIFHQTGNSENGSVPKPRRLDHAAGFSLRGHFRGSNLAHGEENHLHL
jgi:hypothetical protein